MRAISSVTLARQHRHTARQAPCGSLISKRPDRIEAAISLNFSGSDGPSALRTPYFAVPIWKMTSQPPSG